MHKRIPAIVFALGTMFPSSAFCRLSAPDIYVATVEACRSISPREIWMTSFPAVTPKIAGLKAGVTPSAKFNALLKEIEKSSFSMAFVDHRYLSRVVDAEELMGRAEFGRALDECYGNDEYSKDFFHRLVVSADTYGKMSSGILTSYRRGVLHFGEGSVRLGCAFKYRREGHRRERHGRGGVGDGPNVFHPKKRERTMATNLP